MNPTGTDRGGLVERHGCPATGPVHLVAVDDGTLVPAAGASRRSAASASRRTVTGQKIRWVLDLMRGPEFAGSRITRYELERTDDGVVDATPHVRRRRDRRPGRRPRRPARRACSRSPTRASRIAVRVHARAGAARSSPAVEGVARLRLARRSSARRRRRAAPTALRAGEHVARERAPPGRGRPAHRHVLDRRPPTACASRARPARRRRRRRRHLQLLAAGRRPRHRHARGGHGHARTSPARCGRSSASLTWYRWPQHAVGDERRVQPPQRRADPHRGGHDARAARRRARSCACAPSSTTAAATTGSARTSRCPRRSTGSDAECAFAVVDRGLTAEGGRTRPALPTFVSRRFVDASDGAEGLALVHDGLLEYEVVDDGTRARAHAAARHRLPLALGDAAAPEPGRSARPARRPAAPGHRSPSSTRSRSTAATGTTPASTTSPTTCSSRSRASAPPGPGDRPPTGRPLRVDGAVTSAVHREPGGLVVRVYNPAATDEHRRDRARRDAGARLARRPPRPPASSASRASFELARRRHRHRSASTPDRPGLADSRGVPTPARRFATTRLGGRGRAEQRLADRRVGRPARRERGRGQRHAVDGAPPSGGVSSHSSAGCSPCHRSANDSRP